MPPRIPLVQCLRATSTPAPSLSATRSFSATAATQATQRRKHRDPYAIAQAKAKKAANRSRQEVLEKERAGSLGDPVRGVTTSFVQSFDSARPPEPAAESTATESDARLNFYLSKDELDRGVGRSQWLSSPAIPEESEDVETEVQRDGGENQPRSFNDEISGLFGRRNSNDVEQKDPDWARSSALMADLTTDLTPEARRKKLEEEHTTAQEALRRIASLALGSSKDRLRVNKQRCIDVFGRHNTDATLPPKPASAATTGGEQQKMARVGADTGSSEVQIAILTAKIRAVADFLETRGTMDKVNKRNLRLLVHRRAKLLKYLRRKERGGPRWQHLIEKLGLTDGTWKGEITL